MIDLEDGEAELKKSTQEERRRHREDEELRELERRNEPEQQNFKKITAAMAATAGRSEKP